MGPFMLSQLSEQDLPYFEEKNKTGLKLEITCF